MKAHRVWIATASLVLPAGCQRTATLECYPIDPHSPVDLAQIDPISFTHTNYCGRGPTEIEGLDRYITAYCVAKPETGCEPCMYDFDEVEVQLRAYARGLFDDAGCPANYEPEEIVRGCVAEWVETNECCWSGEFFTNPDVCDPGGPSTLP